MHLKTTAVSLTAALAMLATPALAATHTPKAHGKITAPGQICKTFSKKKTDHGKGKSLFAACVSGVKLARSAADKTKSPEQICKTLSKKKTDHGKGKSLFAACVSGAAKA